MVEFASKGALCDVREVENNDIVLSLEKREAVDREGGFVENLDALAPFARASTNTLKLIRSTNSIPF